MVLTSIIGHQFQRNALLHDLQTANVAHAYLFSGPRHIGKFTVARWFAAELLSAGAADQDEKKRIELQVSKLLHPDLLVLDWLWMDEVQDDLDEIAKHSNVPQQHRIKAKAKTDTVSIDDVRALQERLIETGTGRYRCCLIRSVERMQDEAVNALLKILEEPPEGVVFLLTTQAQATLLPTLLSRTRVLPFSRVAAKEMQALLKEIDPGERQFIAHLAQGAPGSAITLKHDPDLLRKERTVHATAVAFWSASSLSERLKMLTDLFERGKDADRLLLHLTLALREEGERMDPRAVEAMQKLAAGLETNASRPLLVQRFVLALGAAE